MEEIFKDIPKELQYLWIKINAYQQRTVFLSSDEMSLFKANLKYFPWWEKYYSINESIHDSYEKEKSMLHEKYYPKKEMELESGIGLYEQMRRVKPLVMTKQSLKESLNYMFKEEPKIRKNYETELKKLWLKYYKKYKLSYNEKI